MEVEFLVPEIGRKIDKPHEILSLKTNAQRLRFLDILTSHTKVVQYKDLKLKIPEPAGYVLNKLIVRNDISKKEKDIKAAKELGEYIINVSRQRTFLKRIFSRP